MNLDLTSMNTEESNKMKPYVIKKILKKRKNPFYLFDRQSFISNYENLENTIKKVYPNYKISYSYKTNYVPDICSLVKKLGGYAEVVSDMEYILATKLGYKPFEIVYNGPAKEEFLKKQVLNNGIVNIDNLDELKKIISFATKYKDRAFDIGLRLNLDINNTFISRFGFELDGDELIEALNMINRSNLRLVGFHCHISRSRSLDAWSKRAKFMLWAADKYISGTPKYLNFGGGMFADLDDVLKSQFSDVPSYEDYANTVFAPIAEHYKQIPMSQKPIVFTEPGGTLISRYICFVTKVINIRNIRGKYYATTNGSYLNLGEVCTMKKLPIIIVEKKKSQNRKRYENIDIVGYTCLEQDVLYHDYCGELEVGDWLCFENVGGYSIVSKPQFIHPNVALYSYDNQSITTSMRDETFDDVFAKFNVK